MQARLQEIRDREAKATKGPWIYVRNLLGVFTKSIIRSNLVFSFLFQNDRGARATCEDAEFIAHARQDIPYLLQALKDAHEIIDRVNKQKASPENCMNCNNSNMEESICSPCNLYKADNWKPIDLVRRKQKQDREKVLQDALITTCSAVEDLMAIGSEYGTCGYQVIVDEARKVLGQEVVKC